ncbi:MAG: type II toxin-antitoxin system RelB/DinJ family antitoxin [Clostridiales Family XIII bacterium]|jgi:DNA-damage-inducible protein J|nr:type II toxin-antitoxin system RelB/DinJ family antitoxin [Clostridiales Family XIII bacterium]
MATTTISVRLDNTTKEQLDHFCEEVGLNTATAFKMFAKNVVRNQRLPFDVETGYALSSKEIKERYEDMKKGRNVVTHDLIEV